MFMNNIIGMSILYNSEFLKHKLLMQLPRIIFLFTYLITTLMRMYATDMELPIINEFLKDRGSISTLQGTISKLTSLE